MTELWRSVVGFENYAVSNQGRVKRIDTQLIMSPRKHKRDGYWLVNLYKESKYTTKPVHRLVMDAFVGLRPKGLVTRHLNGNGYDNRLENLAYGTQQQNRRDQWLHGTNGPKLTPELVRQMRRDHANGMSQYQLAEIYPVNASNCYKTAVSRESWSWVD